MQVLGMNKSAYHVLHLFSFAKSLLISPHPKKTFSLTLVGAFSPPLLAWYDLRASQSCLLLRHTGHSADLGGGAAASRERAQHYISAQFASSHLIQTLPKSKMVIIWKSTASQ